MLDQDSIMFYRVSTHSRAEAAAFRVEDGATVDNVSTHSRAEAAAVMCLNYLSH